MCPFLKYWRGDFRIKCDLLSGLIKVGPNRNTVEQYDIIRAFVLRLFKTKQLN